MSTTIVTPEVEKPAHFADCDSLAIGRRIKLRAAGPDGPDATFTLAELLEHLPVRRNCQCFALQLTRVEADLAARRKAQRAGYERSGEIASLIAARDAIKAAIEATR